VGNPFDTGERALWLAVVLQAKEDIAAADIDSFIWADAVAFFTGGGEWAHARANVADCLDVAPDYLRTQGQTWISARRRAEGLADMPPTPRPPRKPSLPSLKPLRPIAVPVLVATPIERVLKGQGRRWAFNPFNPLLREKITADT
jgi:hypothetical protein